MSPEFLVSLKHVLEWEGGYVDHPHDKGGATNRGITMPTLAAWRGESVGKKDIYALTLNETKAIYWDMFWLNSGSDRLPAPLNYVHFDSYVLHSPQTAVRFLQQAVGAGPDGVWGPKTSETIATALNDEGLGCVIARHLSYRMMHYAKSPDFPHFGRGWIRRTAYIQGVCFTPSLGEFPHYEI